MAKVTKSKKKSTASKKKSTASKSSKSGNLFQRMIEDTPANMILADKEFNITYVNPATIKNLTPLAHLLPIPIDQLVGANIDVFHKNPAVQRNLLNNPANLPHTAPIQLGDQKIELVVNAVYDGKGSVLGTMVTWDFVDPERLRLEALAQDGIGKLDAISRSQAVIEFELDGTICTANENFCNAVGYTLKEIVGQHHSMFVEDSYRQSHDYRAFWDALNRGEFKSDEFKRIAKGGREIWLQASYNPIFNKEGAPIKVIKFATDVTKQKIQSADFSGQINAIGKSQAIIEFNLDGTIITANDNFLNTLGYTLDEVKGRHHSMFVEETYRQSVAYAEFWAALNRGQFQSDEFKRIGRGGKQVWIQASYNPIFDLNGKPYKVVKYATDVTMQVIAREEISKLINAAVNGDLTARAETSRLDGEFSQMVENVNQLVSKICDTMRQVSSAVEQIDDGAGQVTGSSQQLSEGASEQAASLEETSSSLEEMAAMTRTNASNAAQVNELSGSARDAANEGDQTMGQLNQAMSDINASSEKISKIIKVIEEIAFQTNLLALNAAVEAARAGEHGKGFAVVADEVRNLAQRAAQAAGETTGLIDESVKKAQEGTTVATSVGKALSSIVERINKVSDLVDGITKASEEQAQGVDQVNTAVTQMNTVTQQNAAGSEELAAAAEEMSSQVACLRDMMSQYKLVEGGADSGAGNTRGAARPSARPNANRPNANRPAPSRGRQSVGVGANDSDFFPMGDENLSNF
jgi:methyl-accepting chemotaxis protein